MTADEFWVRQDEFEGRELVDGEVVDVSPTKKKHGRSECRIAYELVCRKHKRGFHGLTVDPDVPTVVEALFV